MLENATGDVSTDSYHLYQKDLELVKDLGVSTNILGVSLFAAICSCNCVGNE